MTALMPGRGSVAVAERTDLRRAGMYDGFNFKQTHRVRAERRLRDLRQPN